MLTLTIDLVSIMSSVIRPLSACTPAHTNCRQCPCRSEVKAEEDADMHSQSRGRPTRRKQRSATPEKGELRLTRSMQPKDTQPHLASEQQRPGNSLPAKLDQRGSRGANQGSSGSPGKEASSAGVQRQRNGKHIAEVCCTPCLSIHMCPSMVQKGLHSIQSMVDMCSGALGQETVAAHCVLNTTLDRVHSYVLTRNSMASGKFLWQIFNQALAMTHC